MSCEAPWERSTFFRPADRSWSPRTFLLLILMFFAWWVWGSVTLYCKRQTLSQRLICLRGDDLCLLVWIEAHLLCLAKWACASETFMTPMNVFFRLVRALLPQTPQLLPASSSGTCTASAAAEQKPCTPPDVIFVCNDCLELNNLSDGGCGARLWQRNTSSHCLSLTCFLLEHVRYETKEKSLVAFWECTTLILIFPIALQQKNNGCLCLILGTLLFRRNKSLILSSIFCLFTHPETLSFSITAWRMEQTCQSNVRSPLWSLTEERWAQIK